MGVFLALCSASPMRSDQPRQAIGPFSAFSHVAIIESLDLSYLTQESFQFCIQ